MFQIGHSPLSSIKIEDCIHLWNGLSGLVDADDNDGAVLEVDQRAVTVMAAILRRKAIVVSDRDRTGAHMRIRQMW